jgi:hypothetical protein
MGTAFTVNPQMPDIPDIQSNFNLIKDQAHELVITSRDLMNSLITQLGTIQSQAVGTPSVPDFGYTETPYSNGLENQVHDELSLEITNGGYGLNPQDEADLWNRERDREQVNAMAGMDEVRREASMSGFPVPPGAMNKMIEKQIESSAQKISSVNREISLKRADLYWEGKKFVFDKSLQLEEMLRKFDDAAKNRALETQKSFVTMAIERAKILVSTAIENAKMYLQAQIPLLEAHARIAAAAIGMANLNMSFGAHANMQLGENFSKSQSYDARESVSDNLNVNINQQID